MPEIIPPNSIEAEQSALGSMMIEPVALHQGLELMRDSDFYRPAHQEVFRALQSLALSETPPDLITLTEELRKRNKLDDCGGTEYLMALADSTPTAANLEHYAGIVVDKAQRRQQIAAAAEITAAAYDEDCERPSEMMVSKALEVTDRNHSGRAIEDVVANVFHDFERHQHGEKLQGVPFRLKRLNALTYGCLPGDFIIVAGRPSEGKTVVATELAVSACRAGVPTLFFSLEMSAESLIKRIAFSECRIDGYLVQTSQIPETDDSWVRLYQHAGQATEWPLQIEDNVGTLAEILAIAHRWKLTKAPADGAGLVIVDYLQIVKYEGRAESRNVEVSNITAGLKRIARRLNVPVIALSQLSRLKGERKGNEQKPTLERLRDSGAIEQEADKVLLLHNPVPVEPAQQKQSRIGWFHLAKHRNGPTGVFEAMFMPAYARFEDLANEEQ